jgi:SAM-dependent methyltransferase
MNLDQVIGEWNAMAEDWDDLAGSYADSFYKTLQQKNLLPDESNQDCEDNSFIVMDFGCGTGLLTEKLKDKCRTVIAMDPSPNMILLLQEKIQSREWNNVVALQEIISRPSAAIDSLLEHYTDKIDLIVASSVLHFIPESDLPRTLQNLARLLTPDTGRLCHSDWPQDEVEHPNGMTKQKAIRLYQQAGLTLVESEHVLFASSADSQSSESAATVYFGVAAK